MFEETGKIDSKRLGAPNQALRDGPRCVTKFFHAVDDDLNLGERGEDMGRISWAAYHGPHMPCGSKA